MQLKRPGMVFFDMEGTLLRKSVHLDDGMVAPSAWTLLAERLGPDCLIAENATKVRWRAGGYAGYMAWMRQTVEIHRRFGLTESLFQDVVSGVEFTPGATEALDRIHSWGVTTVLITGGFKALADRVQRKLKIHHAFSGCEYFFDHRSGMLDHANLLPTDEEGKVDFMRLMCREYGQDSSDCAFVGDGMNDVHLAGTVGFSVAFNAQPELERVASNVVRQEPGREDFVAVAEVLGQQWLGVRPHQVGGT